MANRLMLAALAAALLAPEARANGFKGLARELSGAARGAKIERVAVVPFVPSDGGGTHEGWGISERLVTQIVRTGRVRAVERNLLRKLMDEHYLEATGALDAGGLRRLGRVLSVDGIVAGSFVRLGSKALVSARLIDVQTGAIVAAAEQKVERDVFDAPELGQGGGEAWNVPELGVVPPLGPEPESMRDSPSEAASGCADASERVDALEKRILDLKARYWALKLKEGLPASSLRRNPGSTITDPILKREFYRRLQHWHSQESVPKLTEPEARRFVAINDAAFTLHQECGL